MPHVLLRSQNERPRRGDKLNAVYVLGSTIGRAWQLFRVLEFVLQPSIRILKCHLGVGVDDAAVSGLHACVDLRVESASGIQIEIESSVTYCIPHAPSLLEILLHIMDMVEPTLYIGRVLRR